MKPQILQYRVYNNGMQEYRNEHNLLHRENGPAKINNRYEAYYQNGLLHRVDGPAVIYANGIQYGIQYWQNGKRHRVDGPAVISANGNLKEFWVNGMQVPEPEFSRLQAPHNGMEIKFNGVRYRLTAI